MCGFVFLFVCFKSLQYLILNNCITSSLMSPRAMICADLFVCLKSLQYLILNVSIPFPLSSTEYVETFVMPDKYKKMNREAKWTAYLDDEEGRGPILLKCILSKNQLWAGSSNNVAKRVSSVYTLTSDLFHATAHDIDSAVRKDLRDESGRKFPVVSLSNQSSTQILNVMQCIGDTLEFEIACPDPNSNITNKYL
jgi:hypothetical protein